MKRTYTIIAIISTICSLFPFIKSKSRDIITLLWLPKLLSGAFSLFLALGGVVSAIYGWMRRDRKLTLTGSAGALLSLLYIRQVTRGHKGMEQAFGADWRQRIPAKYCKQLQPVRWRGLAIPVSPVPHQRDIVFATSPATGKPLLADIWLPPKRTAATGLGIIYMHGGSWRVGAKDMGTRPFFQRLATLGHAVMDIDYTLWPDCKLTNMVLEVKLALSWFKENSKALGVRPDRIVLMGGSAGGHLALLAGYTPDHPDLTPPNCYPDLSVRGVVAFYPPADFRNLPGDFESLLNRPKPNSIQKVVQDNVIFLMNDSLRIAASLRGAPQPRRLKNESDPFTNPANFISRLVGGAPDEIPETYALLSPAAHVRPGCPPTLLLQGTDDFFELLPGVKRLHQSLQAAGVPSVLVEFPHCEHAFDLIMPQTSPAAQAATQDVEHFLALMI